MDNHPYKWADMLLVHTKDTDDKLARAHGTGNWKIDERRAARCDYVAVVQNGGIARGHARLIGKIASIEESEEHGRKLVRCSAVARVDIPRVWGGWQNPVYYGTSERLDLTREQLEALPWEPWETFRHAVLGKHGDGLEGQSTKPHQVRTVDLATAKEILAAHFGTTPELITLVC